MVALNFKQREKIKMNGRIASKNKEKAAQLLATGRFTVGEIAEKCGGISERTLFNWQKQPKFLARVEAITKAYKENSLKRGLAEKEQRVLELQRAFNLYSELLENRRARTEFNFIPDYKSGLIAITEVSMLRRNRRALPDVTATTSPEAENDATGEMAAATASDPWAAAMASGQYRVKVALDHQTIAAMCSILDQIAEEVGDKVRKTEISLPKRLADMSDQELFALAERLGVAVPPELRA
jgi:hypothetical protein